VDLPGHRGRPQTPCQGEGRGFESRLRLSKSHLLAGLMRMAPGVQFTVSARHCPSLPVTARHYASLPVSCPSWDKAGAMDAGRGSIRQRGSNSYELRVYGGTDPISGRRRWLTRTVHGKRSDALRDLKAKQYDSGYGRRNAEEPARSVKAREPSMFGSVRWPHRRRFERHVSAVNGQPSSPRPAQSARGRLRSLRPL
jgi:hypothetical protein